MKEKIEEERARTEWLAQARSQTAESLPEFIRHLSLDYEHDYGTIVYAVAAVALAAARVVDHCPSGGITGFQAGCVMWTFIREWLHLKGPIRLVEYNKMLYPQYEHDFDKILPRDIFEYLQAEATKELKELPDRRPTDSEVVKHWKKIAAGEVPFGYRLEEAREDE